MLWCVVCPWSRPLSSVWGVNVGGRGSSTGPRAASLEPVDDAPASALEDTQVALFLARLG